jgi:trans-aconitate methyltransferase
MSIVMNNHYEKFTYPSDHVSPADYVTSYITTPFRMTKTLLDKVDSVLVVGCGWAEATQIAHHFKDTRVVGVDTSTRQISTAQRLKRELRLDNLELICDDAMNLGFNREFDSIIATGVLHHVKNVRPLLSRLHSYGKKNCILSGMVYSSNRRFIDREAQVFRTMNLSNTDFKDISYVASVLEHHADPRVRSFYETHLQTPNEIVDTWMHYYARTYSKASLIRLMMKHDFYPVYCGKFDDPYKLLFSFVGG